MTHCVDPAQFENDTGICIPHDGPSAVVLQCSWNSRGGFGILFVESTAITDRFFEYYPTVVNGYKVPAKRKLLSMTEEHRVEHNARAPERVLWGFATCSFLASAAATVR